jgi:glycosyltransferase involved in cell wall biosynthesis
MRLVHLAAYDGPYPGSSIPMIRAALLEARRLGWHGEAVFAETARGRDWLASFAEDGIPVRIVERGSRSEMTRQLRALLDERPNGPTVLHTHFTAYDVPAVQAARGRPDTSVVWHLHTPPNGTLATALRSRVKFSLYGRNVAAILCVAPHMAERVARIAPAGRTSFFPNGIDTAHFTPPTPQERRQARADLGIETTDPLLGHLAWDWEVKGGDILLEAAQRLKARGQPVSVVTRVAAPEAARALRERLGLEAEVTVLERLERIQTLYAAVDAFISPSRSEGMPFAVLEALLSGVPVVASDIPGHALIAGDYPGCRLVPLDAESLADGVADLFNEPPEAVAAETAEAGRRIAERMSLEAWTRRLFDLYGRALQG